MTTPAVARRTLQHRVAVQVGVLGLLLSSIGGCVRDGAKPSVEAGKRSTLVDTAESAQALAHIQPKRNAFPMDPQDFEFDSPKVEQWLSYTLGLPEQAFVSLSGLEGALFDPLDQSRSGMDYFLKEDFLPHQNRSLNARWSAHAASSEEGIDLLRAFFESGDLNFRLFEGRNFLLLQVAADDREHAFRDGRRAYVGRLIDRVVVTSMFSHTWEIRLPVETNDMSHSFVVTNEGAPGVDEIHDRNDRIDVLINSYQTAFLFYKKVGQRVLFMPGHEWFSDDARTLILGNQTQ